MDKARDAYKAFRPPSPPPCVLAALGPRMLELAAERVDGAHTYFVPAEHTSRARRILGPQKLLVPEQAVVLDDDPDRARLLARSHIRRYLSLPNYVANLRRLGYADDDFTGDGSDRLVDAIVAHGDPDAINSRVRAHREAGATHVSLQLLAPTTRQFPIDQWRVLLSG